MSNGLGNDTWDMRCALRPIYAASGCVANGHCSTGAPSQLTGNYQPIVLKNSTRKFRRKKFGHEKAIAVEFLTATSFNTTLGVKRFLKIDTFLISE
jgi:hypothetical protein